MSGSHSSVPEHGAAPRSRRWIFILAIVLVLSVGGAVAALSAARGAAQTAFDAQYAEFLSTKAAAADVFVSANAALEAARTTLADSEGKVLTEDSRTALAAAIAAAGVRVTAAETRVDEADDQAHQTATATGNVLDTGAHLREGTATLASFSLTTVSEVTTVADELAGPIADVAAAMAAWQAEQDRIIAARYTNHVHAVGWIAELDECKGSVDLSAQYGTAAIAEHWSCGGKDFPDEPGTIITLTGERAGTYRVDGIVMMLNQHKATIADIPHGYDLIYQTCQNGQSSTMSLTALTKLE
jgi:hypothetical protein